VASGATAGAAAVGRYVVAFFLLVAAIPKLTDRPSFRRSVEGLGINRRVAALAAALVPWIELLSAAALLAGCLVAPVAAGDAVMFVVFAFVVARAARLGRASTCGCFGRATPRRAGPSLVALDVVLVGTSVVVASLAGSAGWRLGFLRPAGDQWAFALVALAAVLGYLLVESWLPVWSTLRSPRPSEVGA
jgi:uncharacterized membrane protein YphA (DoxX/SURF4 family)